MTLNIRLLSARLAMMQYALMHIANEQPDTILIGEGHAQQNLVHIIKMREPDVEIKCHTPDFTQRDYQQKHNRKTGAAKHRRQAKQRRRSK